MTAAALPVETWGTGPTPVVFLHGFTGSGASWRHLEPELSSLVTATCPDLPGHGQAPLGAATGPTGFVEAVDAVAALIEKPSVVVGYSQGARLALALALRHPQRVSRLVLESGTAGLQRRRDRLARRAADEALARSIVSRGVEAFIRTWETLPLFDGLKRLPSLARDSVRLRRLAHTAEGLAWALRAMGRGAQPSYWPELHTLRKPTLILNGARDARHVLIGQRLASVLPLAWRRAFPDTWHVPHLECASAYAAELKAFLTAKWGEGDDEVVP